LSGSALNNGKEEKMVKMNASILDMTYLDKGEFKMADKKHLIAVIVLLIAGIGVTIWSKTQKVTTPEPQQQYQPAPTQPQVTPPPPQNNEPPSRYKEAIQLSKTSGKKVVLYFTADWCSQCQKMKSVFADPSVKQALAAFIFYEVNTDQERDVTRQYAVRGIPAYKIVDGNEKVLKEGAGSISSQEFLAWLGGSLPPSNNNKIPDLTPKDRLDQATPGDRLDPLTPKDKIDDFLKRD